MRIDIVDIGGIDAGALHRRHHAAIGPVAVLGRRGDVEGVARQAVADDLGIDPGAPRLGVLELFEHHDARALAHHEAVAVAVIGARRALRLIVEIGRERAAGGEARDRQPADRRLGAAREHHVGIAERHQPRGIADGMRAGRAGGDHGVVRTFEAMLDRDIAGGEIDQASGNEERADAARALLGKQQRGLLDALKAADARADQHAGADLVLIGGRLPAGILQRLGGGAHGVDDEVVDLALLLRLHPVVGLKLPSEPSPRGTWQATWQDRSETSKLSMRRAAFWPAVRRSHASLVAAAERRDETQACDDDTSHRAFAWSSREPIVEPFEGFRLSRAGGEAPARSRVKRPYSSPGTLWRRRP